MANGTNSSLGLSFSRDTFAKLTPGPFLHAHLKQPDPFRPNGRAPNEFRKPRINTGSLTHSNGSAVVRTGDTAVVCGVRGEILLASDIPHPPNDDVDEDDIVDKLGLLVPNLELSTGCSPAHLPGNPPGTLAQSLSYRILSLLRDSNLIRPTDLQIQYLEPHTDEDLPDERPKIVTKAYWTLYIDTLCIALDGNAFDAAWIAVIAALRDTVLPKAWWDPDREIILCSPRLAEASRLQLNSVPLPSTFAVCSTASPLKNKDEVENWVLADPDAYEEEFCGETLTVVTSSGPNGQSGLLRLEKNGGSVVGEDLVMNCVRFAEHRWSEWKAVFGEAG